jgi:hypothetical protein
MRFNFFGMIALVFAFSAAAAAFAQSVVIAPRKITYRRPKPQSEYKKSFTISYPKIKNLSPTLAKKIESSLSYEKVLRLNIKEELGEFQWLEEAGYEVEYNKNGILDVVLSMSGSAAYPSFYDKAVVVDLRTGETVKPSDVFINLDRLAAECRRMQKAEITKALVDIKKEAPDVEDPAELFRETSFTPKDLSEFSVGDKGVTFRYDYAFVHALLALQPEGRYFFTWRELKPFIKRGGLLAKFVR